MAISLDISFDAENYGKTSASGVELRLQVSAPSNWVHAVSDDTNHFRFIKGRHSRAFQTIGQIEPGRTIHWMRTWPLQTTEVVVRWLNLYVPFFGRLERPLTDGPTTIPDLDVRGKLTYHDIFGVSHDAEWCWELGVRNDAAINCSK